MNEEQKKMSPTPTGLVVDGVYAINNDFVSFYLIKSNSGFVAVDAGADNDFSRRELSSLGIRHSDIKTVLLTHDHGDHIQGLTLFDNAKVYAVNPEHANVTIKDGDKLDIDGLSVQVIACVGHKWDSVCFFVDGKNLFTGDNMSLNGNKVGLFNSVYNNSDEEQKRDLNKLSKLQGIKNTFNTHYGWTDRVDFGDFGL